MIVCAVVDDALSPDFPLGVEPETFIRLEGRHITGTAPSRMSAFVPAERLLVLYRIVCAAKVEPDIIRLVIMAPAPHCSDKPA